MAEIIINSCDKTPNYDAIEAVAKFMLRNYVINRHSIGYQYKQEAEVCSGRKLQIIERQSDGAEQTCDCVFDVTNLGT